MSTTMPADPRSALGGMARMTDEFDRSITKPSERNPDGATSAESPPRNEGARIPLGEIRKVLSGFEHASYGREPSRDEWQAAGVVYSWVESLGPDPARVASEERALDVPGCTPPCIRCGTTEGPCPTAHDIAIEAASRHSRTDGPYSLCPRVAAAALADRFGTTIAEATAPERDPCDCSGGFTCATCAARLGDHDTDRMDS